MVRQSFLPALALAGLLMAAGGASAQMPSPSDAQLAQARELVALTTNPTTFDRLAEEQREAFREAVRSADRKAKRRDIDALFERVALPLLRERYAAMLERRAQHFAASLSPGDIAATLAFYQGPAGSALGAAQRDPSLPDELRKGVRSSLPLGQLLGLPGRIAAFEEAALKAGLDREAMSVPSDPMALSNAMMGTEK